MRFNDANVALANRLREQIQDETETVSDGEAVAITILWSFLQDHAECQGIELEQLAREQLDAFIVYARKNLKMKRP